MSDQASILHAQGQAAWDASPEVLAFLEKTLQPGWRTLETGAGQTTLVFAARGCVHEVVTPSSEEIAAIRARAAQSGISMEQVSFLEGFSQDVLPRVFSPAEDIDLVLIDGGH